MSRTSAFALIAALAASPAAALESGPRITYAPNSLAQSQIDRGPWTLHERGEHFGHDASGVIPTTSGPPYSGAGAPYAGYCDRDNDSATRNHGVNLMQPYYFPFVRRAGPFLEGFFDYRPRNEEEATVGAISTDWGATWQFMGEALGLNPYCPWDDTDPDNLNVSVDGVKTAYGSDPASAADNGLGHPTVLEVNGVERVYSLDRANGLIDSAQLVIHKLPPFFDAALEGLPKYGYVSPLGSGGYPQLEPTATSTTGLINPDAMMGSVKIGATTVVLYVEKTLNGDVNFPANEICKKTPAFALTNLDHNGKAKGVNDDVTYVRVATTTDGVNFKTLDAVATGLNDPTATAFNGIRWLGSGSIIRLRDGRYGMFFGAGNCLDNDSDGFHFIGYAETLHPVAQPEDLLEWRVINGFDNPILSTDTVTDTSSGQTYPANPPIVNVTGADALTPAQV
ncbi:MAG TPA: hypothetical protein VKS78_19800, partial [Roseiarcus sp.]|nr:hypothetical protein [Roseiarcus sp.]